MDDYLDSCKSEKEARNRITEVIKINSIAGFEMHSWAISNNVDLPEQAKKSKSGKKESRLCDRVKERVLGLIWDTEADLLRFNVTCEKIPSDLLNGIGCPTKREVLRVVMSVFDPLGMLSPFTLKAKILLRRYLAKRYKLGYKNSAGRICEMAHVVTRAEGVKKL